VTTFSVGAPRALAAIFVCIVLAPCARAASSDQSPDQSFAFEDLGFTTLHPADARSSALPSLAASTADPAALIHNPAGLGRIKRMSAMAAFAYDRSQVTLDTGSGPTGSPVEVVRLSFAGAAVPLPVARGSLVPAIAIHRMVSSERNIEYSRPNEANAPDRYSMQQTGGTYSYGLGVGFDLSAALSTGFSAFLLDGSARSLVQYNVGALPGTEPHTYVLSDTDTQLSGYGMRVGVELYALRNLQIGVCLTSPVVINTKANQLVETTQTVPNDIGSFERVTATTSTRYQVPYRVDTAIAVPLHSLLLTAQMGFQDWAKATIDKHHLATQNFDSVLRRTLEFSAGAEWSVSPWPLRLRAGFSHAETPYAYLDTDRIRDGGLERITAESGRTRVTAGAAVLIRASVVVEASFSRTTATRSSASLTEDDRNTFATLQGSYWF
jgi:hypothetical protein